MRYLSTQVGGVRTKGLQSLPALNKTPVVVSPDGDLQLGRQMRSGYGFTGGFTDRTTGQAGASDIGTDVSYTQDMVDNDRFMRFGFDGTRQEEVDVPYWTEPTPAPADGIELFGGSYMPDGVYNLFDYGVNNATFNAAVESGSFQYTAATGSYNFSDCEPGDLLLCRFDFNLRAQIANTTVETGLIWQTRLSDGTPTFTFHLAGPSIFLGTGTVGRTYLQRPLITAYFASTEDVNAMALPCIRSDNPVLVQPLTTLVTIVR